jgi:C4-dicarboxylate-specific signal transduction histidine kinase
MLLELAGAESTLEGRAALDAVLDGIEAVEQEAERFRQNDARLQELVDALYALASLDFSHRPALRGDGSPIDAAVGCVAMVSEELAYYVDQRGRVERALEERVQQRTADITRANEDLRREIAERRRTEHVLHQREEQLLQAGKMAAVGQLAAGVAHEINNPLAVILGFSQGLERRMGDVGEQFKVPVSGIVREALRCRNLVQELLVFSRTAKRTTAMVDLGRLLSSAGHLLDVRARTQNTKLSLELPPRGATLRANETQIEQVLVNLGNNSLDALQKDGHLTLRASFPNDESAVIEVEDTGPGIPEDVRPRIFEPFFTTKEVGKGTGLGLSLVYEIVRQHGGSIDVHTEVGQGTRIRVRLPIDASIHDVASTAEASP